MNYTLTITSPDPQAPPITIPFESEDQQLVIAQRVIGVLLQKKRTRGPNKPKTGA